MFKERSGIVRGGNGEKVPGSEDDVLLIGAGTQVPPV